MTDETEDPAPSTTAASGRAARSRVLKGASAAFNSEFSAIPCQIRNMSDSGARLVFEGGWFVPDRFTLHVDIDGYKRDCERVWQRGSECGVRFTGPRTKTGRPRQQVIAPEAVAGEEPGRRAEAPPTQQPETPPVRSAGAPGPRPAGFGRRTR